MKQTKRLTYLSVLTAASLCVFVLEAQIPPLVPIPGIKLGLSNVFTLFTCAVLGLPSALAQLLIRVTLGSVITGQLSALGYSLCGGLLSFLLLALMHKRFPARLLWVLSAMCAVAHNLGQLILASFIMNSSVIFWYFPALILSGMLTGAFTGLACQLVLRHMKRGKLLSNR